MPTPPRVPGSQDVGFVAAHWKPTIKRWANEWDIVPITGAGVGMNFGLPSWQALTLLMCDALEAAGDTSHADVRSETDLMLRAFRATERLNTIGSDLAVRSLHSAVYADTKITRDGVIWLECIYRLALIAGVHFTFNFDDLFEMYVGKLHDKRAIISEFGRMSRSVEGQIDSYHIHGSLRYSPIPTTMPKDLVFDTISYVRAYASVHDRIGTSLLYYMTNYKCVFLGLSMVDPDLLRLICLSQQIRGDGSCWAIAFGKVSAEISKLLGTWGVAVVDRLNPFVKIPTEIIGCLPRYDPMTKSDFDELELRARRLLDVSPTI